MKLFTQHHKTLHLVSLGCTKNLVDSEVMLDKLHDYKLIDDANIADVIIVNTCGFISSAKEESINTILNLHSLRKKDSILVMAGCLSQRYKDELQNELSEVDIFTGVGDYSQIDKLLEEKKSKFSNKVFLASHANNRVITSSNYHAYIKISEGCNQTCSFCAIPSFKGKLYSRTLSSIVKEIKILVSKGYVDFTFVSQDSSSFLKDLNIKDGLEKLIDEVDKIEGIKSARILYLYPSTTKLALIEKIKNSLIFENYFDMPLQHISSKMLKLMKRGKGVEKLNELMQSMKNVENSFLRTTFIVGHPEENEEDFDILCKYVEDFKFDRANVFSYSDEEDTNAFLNINKIPQNIIDKRADILGEIIKQNTLLSLENEVNKECTVYIDKVSDEHEYLLSARKTLWAPDIDGEIYINDNNTTEELKFGKRYKVKITEVVGDKLLATALELC